MRGLCLFALAAITALAVTLPALADDKKDEGKKEGGSEAMPMPTAPKELDQIADLIGEWKVEGEVPAGAASPKASKEEGTFVIRKAIGGMYLVGDYQTKGGLGNFTGHEVIGFNTQSGKFKSFWFDNMMSGYASQATGEFKDNTLTLDSEEEMPGPDGKTVKMTMRITYKFDGKDKIEWKGESKKGDKWETWMSATYTRTK